MDSDFPSEFDLIVVGTGFSESVIAAAAARVGKTVLHVDSNDYYGGYWASFSLESFLSHLNSEEITKCTLSLCRTKWLQELTTEEDAAVNGWTKNGILKENRRFSIDLIPKMNFCNGKLVELLISSNICRYTEFRAVDKVLTSLDGQLDIVPGSRSDIFTKKNVGIIEKRLLMKFMTQCLEFEKEPKVENSEFTSFPADGKFLDLMKQQKLTEKIIHYILHSMCMGNENTTFAEGIERVKTYLSSIGRYGNTPFLFPMYGCGEIPQCFCRLCAVFGGIYCLGRKIGNLTTIESNDEHVVKMDFEGQQITGKKLVSGFGTVLDENQTFMSRAVLITTSPVGGAAVNSETDGGGVVLMYHPLEGREDGVTMIQLSHFSGCVPKGLYLVHLTSNRIKAADEDLQPFINTFFTSTVDPENKDDSKPLVLFSAFFEIPTSNKNCDQSEVLTGPMYTCSGPFLELDYDESIRQSKILFEKMYPGEEFLPKAPEPDQIIMGDEDATEVGVNLGVLADLVDENKGEVKEGLLPDSNVVAEIAVEEKIDPCKEAEEEEAASE